MLLDDESWNTLKEKAIEHFRDERDGQRKQSFFNQLNESFAYRYLLHKGCKNVRFIKEGKKKSPNISFIDRGTESYCEVKTVGVSDDEINRRARHRAYDCGLYFNLTRDFKTNWEQTLTEHGNKFILSERVVSFSFSCDLMTWFWTTIGGTESS